MQYYGGQAGRMDRVGLGGKTLDLSHSKRKVNTAQYKNKLAVNYGTQPENHEMDVVITGKEVEYIGGTHVVNDAWDIYRRERRQAHRRWLYLGMLLCRERDTHVHVCSALRCRTHADAMHVGVSRVGHVPQPWCKIVYGSHSSTCCGVDCC